MANLMSGKTLKRTDVLGKSALTGRYVLKPASKAGAISLSQARAAVALVMKSKKQ